MSESHEKLYLPTIFAILSAIFFGTVAPMTKLMLGSVEPVMLAALFYLGSGVGMLIIVSLKRIFFYRSATEATLTKSDLPYILCMAFFGGVLAPIVISLSMTLTPSATGSLLLNFEPVVTTLLAFFVFHEAIGKRIWVAMILIGCSCVLLGFDPKGDFALTVGALGIILACTFWGLDNNISRKVSGKDPMATIMVKGILAGVFSVMFALIIGEQLPPLFDIPAILIIGFFSYGGVASVFFLMALRSLGAARTALFLSLSPFFGVLYSLVLFNELPGIQFVPALIIMAIGTYLLVTERHIHEHHHVRMIHEHRHSHDLHHMHEHGPGVPPLSALGVHSHMHIHEAMVHSHVHKPDLHHQHKH